MDDFESEQAIEEAARALIDHSAIAMLSLAQGETPAAVRQRLTRFVAGAPPRGEQPASPGPASSSANPSRGAASSSTYCGTPGSSSAAAPSSVRRLVPADSRAAIVANIRRPTH